MRLERAIVLSSSECSPERDLSATVQKCTPGITQAVCSVETPSMVSEIFHRAYFTNTLQALYNV